MHQCTNSTLSYNRKNVRLGDVRNQTKTVMKLSLVVPCFNEEACIEPFYNAVSQLSLPCELEFIFVDDGSSDQTFTRMRTLHEKDNGVRALSFSRIFGKEAVLLAGLKATTGDYVVTLDVDLQHPVTLLPEMLSLLKEGQYDSVATRRISREKNTPLHNFLATCFYRILKHISKIETQNGETDYRMMTRQMVNAILTLPEVNRFTKGIYAWVGFKTKWLTFENVERSYGKSKWSLIKLAQYSVEGLSAFSTLPLQISSIIGFFCFVSAFVYLLYVIIKTLLFGEAISGYPTIVCLILFLGGIQLLVIGILGNYLAKTYLETKQRPMYLIKEEL